MKAHYLCSKLRGVIAFPITPFKSDLSLDIAGLRNNLQQLLQHKISAIVAAGGTSEMYSLSRAEHLAAGPVRPPLPTLRPDELAEAKKVMERWKHFL
jgi:hypothetical protein